MTLRTALLAAHAILLLLASTALSFLPGVSSGSFHWEYFRYASQSGWGSAYQFPYSLPVVLLYCTASGTGLVAFALAGRAGLRAIGIAGVILCGLGSLSFAHEFTHWLKDH